MPAKMSDKCRGCLAGQAASTRGARMAATQNIRYGTAERSFSRALVLDRLQTMDGVKSTHTVLVFDEL
jgi:hypothetical protein